MSTEIKFGEAATMVEEVAIGAAQTAAKVASDPIGSARKSVRGFEKKGAPTARKVNRRFNARLNAILPEKVTLWGIEVNEKLPEKVAIKGLHLVKLQARRQDMVGDVAKRTLRIFNGSFKTIARTATRLEQATSLTPHRTTAAKPAVKRQPRRRIGGENLGGGRTHAAQMGVDRQERADVELVGRRVHQHRAPRAVCQAPVAAERGIARQRRPRGAAPAGRRQESRDRPVALCAPIHVALKDRRLDTPRGAVGVHGDSGTEF